MGDVAFLEKCFHKLLMNFAWWVNKVDSQGLNVFEGGFLGLDNITVVDRSEKLPNGAILEQSDATGWMGFFCLHMMRIALELAGTNRVYETLATKFFEHFTYIGGAMKHMGGRGYQLWDEDDGFFYDVLRFPDGSFHKFRVRSLVGLIPLYAIEVLDPEKSHFSFTEKVVMTIAFKTVLGFTSEWKFLPDLVLATVSVDAMADAPSGTCNSSDRPTDDDSPPCSPPTDEHGTQEQTTASVGLQYGTLVSCIDFGGQLGALLGGPLVALFGTSRDNDWSHLGLLQVINSTMMLLSIAFLFILVRR